MHFVIIVEGKTEKLAIPDFIRKWLDKGLCEKVGIKQRLFIGRKLESGYSRQAGKIIETDNKNEIIGVIGLRDLYGMGYDLEGKSKGKERLIRDLSTRIESPVNEKRFKMFFAVHELEAWLFSDSEIFPTDIKSEITRISQPPENIDFDKPPSRRLKDIYNRKTKGQYGKTTTGRDLFSKLDPNDAYDRCPYFKLMLDTMEKMANDAGIESRN